MAKQKYTFIDLFAGAGGLSEGFIRAGFEPIAHIEMKKEACDTLRTRAAFHYLKDNNQLDVYKDYLFHKQEKEDGSKLWNQVPKDVIDTVIQSEIGEKTLTEQEEIIAWNKWHSDLQNKLMNDIKLPILPE